MSKKEDFKPKTYTKQEIDVKTESSNRVLPEEEEEFDLSAMNCMDLVASELIE